FQVRGVLRRAGPVQRWQLALDGLDEGVISLDQPHTLEVLTRRGMVDGLRQARAGTTQQQQGRGERREAAKADAGHYCATVWPLTGMLRLFSSHTYSESRRSGRQA